MHIELARIDDQVCIGAQPSEGQPLAPETVHQPLTLLKGVRTPVALEAPHEALIRGLEEENADIPALIAQTGERTFGVVEEPAAAHIHHDSHACDGTVLSECAHRLRDQAGEQVVDDEPAAVFECARRRGPARPAHPRDEDHLSDTGFRQVHAHDCTSDDSISLDPAPSPDAATPSSSVARMRSARPGPMPGTA